MILPLAVGFLAGEELTQVGATRPDPHHYVAVRFPWNRSPIHELVRRLVDGLGSCLLGKGRSTGLVRLGVFLACERMRGFGCRRGRQTVGGVRQDIAVVNHGRILVAGFARADGRSLVER